MGALQPNNIGEQGTKAPDARKTLFGRALPEPHSDKMFGVLPASMASLTEDDDEENLESMSKRKRKLNRKDLSIKIP